MQDTVLAALRRGVHNIRDLRAWLSVSARNFAVERNRLAANRVAREQRASRPEGHSPSSDEGDQLAAVELMTSALRELTEQYRTAVLKRHIEGLSYEELARSEGVERVRGPTASSSRATPPSQ